MILQKILLFSRIEFWQYFELPEMRPAILVVSLQFIVTTLGQQAAYGNMHQVLFLFFGEFLPYIPEFLDPYQEQNGFHVRFLAKALHQFRFQVPPANLQVIL